MNLPPLEKLKKISYLSKRNLQKKSKFIGGIGITEDKKITIEIRREGNRVIDINNPYIITIFATSMESALSKIKKIARKRYSSNSTWNNSNVPIILYGTDQLIEHQKWMLKIRNKPPFSKNKNDVRRYNKRKNLT